MESRKVGRRGFFARAISEMGARVEEEARGAPPPRRRPPGAVEEELFLARCTACSDCVDACPERAIHRLAPFVRPGAGTPVMLPEQSPCVLCDGFPCVAACEPEALVMERTKSVTLGQARVNAARCLPYLGPECGACRGACPDGYDAIHFTLGRPSIDESCIGCGLCIRACPTTPSAIELEPIEVAS